MERISYIEIKNVSISCRLGITEQERSHRQRIFITCKIYGAFDNCMKSDNISDAINYVEVVNAIEHFTQKRSFNLIEHLAEEIRKSIFKLCEYDHIEIKIKKPNALRNAEYSAFTLRA